MTYDTPAKFGIEVSTYFHVLFLLTLLAIVQPLHQSKNVHITQLFQKQMPFSFYFFCFNFVCFFFSFQEEESLTLLKSLPLAKAEEVAERLTLWGRLVLRNKADDPEEVPRLFTSESVHTSYSEKGEVWIIPVRANRQWSKHILHLYLLFL